MGIKKFLPFHASNVYEFVDPDTGYKYSAETMGKLVSQINMYRLNNGLAPIEAVGDVVENYLCGLGVNSGRCKDVELNRSWVQYIKGGIALLKNMAFKKFCSDMEAEVRAAQCVKCEYNVFPDKGPFMDWADEIAVKQVGEKRVSVHNELGNCAACSCPLRAKVFIGGPVGPFNAEELEKMRKVNCWQLKVL